MTREIEKRKAPPADETPKQRALRMKLERAD
eukprot:CAMPEP_0168316476 /NCGR_PEP_ID=MMETSP0210-20121227/15726_1 /TAXON_ID=40633 /ORGANISM="Condylostoma magnum, Strain COL2" /LENGTH=30 /DNA_ID= /DNA_START= /DNA_END= /DNA_ORIENTATION=